MRRTGTVRSRCRYAIMNTKRCASDCPPPPAVTDPCGAEMAGMAHLAGPDSSLKRTRVCFRFDRQPIWADSASAKKRKRNALEMMGQTAIQTGVPAVMYPGQPSRGRTVRSLKGRRGERGGRNGLDGDPIPRRL